MPSNSGNENRALWRTKCRRRLSEYLLETLNVSIPPEEIRLRPNKWDCYRWKIKKPSNDHLFKKDLSKLSTRAYMQLYREAGKTFYATSADNYDKTPECNMNNNTASGGEGPAPASWDDSAYEKEAGRIEIDHWRGMRDSTLADNKRLNMELERNKMTIIKYQKYIGHLLTKAKLDQHRITELETRRESYIQELFNIAARFKDDNIYKPPTLPDDVLSARKE